MTLTPDDVKKITSGTSRRTMLNNSRGAINFVKDSGNIQTVQLDMLDEETRDKVERLQEFGFTSNPPSDCDAALIAIGGNRDHLIVVATDSRQYRKKNLEPGEVAIYDKKGSVIYLKKDGTIEIKPDTKAKIVIGTGTFEMTSSKAEFTFGGKTTKIDSTGVTFEGVSLETHTHPYTDTPIGASNTSAPNKV